MKKIGGYSITNILFIGYFTGEKKTKYEAHHFSQELMLTVALFKRSKRVKGRIK